MKKQWIAFILSCAATQMSFADASTTPPVPIMQEVSGLYVLSAQGCQDPVTGQYVGITFGPGNQVSYNVKEVVRQVFTNLEGALEVQHLTLGNTTQINVYMTRKDDYATMLQVWNSLFMNAQAAPTMTVIFVSDLPGKNIVMMDARAGLSVAHPYNQNALL